MEQPMGDLTSRAWIVAKGIMILAIMLIAAVLVWLEAPSLTVAVLLVLVAWSSARFYYFLFYVLEKYVDSTLKYAGILALVRSILARKGATASEGNHGRQT